MQARRETADGGGPLARARSMTLDGSGRWVIRPEKQMSGIAVSASSAPVEADQFGTSRRLVPEANTTVSPLHTPRHRRCEQVRPRTGPNSPASNRLFAGVDARPFAEHVPSRRPDVGGRARLRVQVSEPRFAGDDPQAG